MSEPMTTKTATRIFCKGESCPDKEDCCNCVESATCSMRCDHCRERIWFQGNGQDQPLTFLCPYCGKETSNFFKRGRKSKKEKG